MYKATEPPFNPSSLPEYLSRELRQIEAGLQSDYVFANGVRIFTGTGAPENTVAAPVGSLYLRADGGTSTSLYVKESGTGVTGWVAK